MFLRQKGFTAPSEGIKAVKVARRWNRISGDHEIWSAIQVIRAGGAMSITAWLRVRYVGRLMLSGETVGNSGLL